MTMHLEGPWLSTTGKKKGPKKWASSEAKAHAERLAREWRDREREWAKLAPNFSTRNNSAKTSRPPLNPSVPAHWLVLVPKYPRVEKHLKLTVWTQVG
jgi:hypothetical protein